MSFIKHLREKNSITEEIIIEKNIKITENKIEDKVENILRDNNFKIKSIHGTKFGTEFLMAKQYPKDDIKKILKDYTLKFNDQSIFVIT